MGRADAPVRRISRDRGDLDGLPEALNERVLVVLDPACEGKPARRRRGGGRRSEVSDTVQRLGPVDGQQAAPEQILHTQ